MTWTFWYFAMALSTTTFLWSLFDSRGTLDDEGKQSAMLMGLLWPITIVILIYINFGNRK